MHVTGDAANAVKGAIVGGASDVKDEAANASSDVANKINKPDK